MCLGSGLEGADSTNKTGGKDFKKVEKLGPGGRNPGPPTDKTPDLDFDGI